MDQENKTIKGCVLVKLKKVSYYEIVCPRCNAKHGPFDDDDIEILISIKCDSCELDLIAVK